MKTVNAFNLFGSKLLDCTTHIVYNDIKYK